MAAPVGIPLKSVYIVCASGFVFSQVKKQVVTSYLCLCWCMFYQWSTLNNLN